MANLTTHLQKHNSPANEVQVGTLTTENKKIFFFFFLFTHRHTDDTYAEYTPCFLLTSLPQMTSSN